MDYRKIIKNLKEDNDRLKEKLKSLEEKNKEKKKSGYTNRDIDFIVNSYLELAQDMNNKILELEKQIESCLKCFVRCSEQNISDYFQRVDELFLLWAKVENCSFVKAVESFGINYLDFNNKDYQKVSNQIVNKYKKYFEELN